VINSARHFFCISVEKILLNGNNPLLAGDNPLLTGGLQISCSVKKLQINLEHRVGRASFSNLIRALIQHSPPFKVFLFSKELADTGEQEWPETAKSLIKISLISVRSVLHL